MLYFKLVILQLTKQFKNLSLASPICCALVQNIFLLHILNPINTSLLLILKVNFHLYLSYDFFLW